MRVTVLNEDHAGKVCGAEHGLSLLIDADKKILFDVGPSGIFLKNTQTLGANLDDVDFIVLSHGHHDHGNGLNLIKNKKLVCHPDCFIKKYRKKDGHYNGLQMTLEEAKKNFELILSKEPYQISENIIFLGEIPRTNDFEAKKTDFFREGKKEDFIMDDSALAIKSEKGLVVISGCSHSGICNILEYAKKVSGVENIYAVIGGFHMETAGEVTIKTIDYFKKERIEKVYPSHCTELPALSKFYEVFNISQTRSGDIIEL